MPEKKTQVIGTTEMSLLSKVLAEHTQRNFLPKNRRVELALKLPLLGYIAYVMV